MALINCPECNHEISDKVKACPHCGYPLVEIDSTKHSSKKAVISKKVIIIASGTLLVVTIVLALTFFVLIPQYTCSQALAFIEQKNYEQAELLLNRIPNYKASYDLKSRVKYEKAEILVNESKYEDALALLSDIPNYSNVATLTSEIKYKEAMISLDNGDLDMAEKLANEIKDYQGAAELFNKIKYSKGKALLDKGNYKDAESILLLIPNFEDVATLLDQIKYESKLFQCIDEYKKILKNPDSLQIHEVSFYLFTPSEQDSKNPKTVCILDCGAQNGFGGNVTAYVLFSENNTYVGSCQSLNMFLNDDYMDQITAQLIWSYRLNLKVGSVDLNRVKALLKSESYSTVKIIN